MAMVAHRGVMVTLPAGQAGAGAQVVRLATREGEHTFLVWVLSWLFMPASASYSQLIFSDSRSANPGNNLHVSGLSHRVDSRDLEAAFAKIGRVCFNLIMIHFPPLTFL